MKYLKSYNLFESVDMTIQDIDRYKPMLIKISEILNMENIPELFFEKGNLGIIYRLFSNLRDLTKVSIIDSNNKDLIKKLSINKIDDNLKFDPSLLFEDLKKIDTYIYMVNSDECEFKISNKWIGSITIRTIDGYEKWFKSCLSNLNSVYKSIEHLKPFRYTIEDVEDLFIDDIDDRKVKLKGNTSYSNPNRNEGYYGFSGNLIYLFDRVPSKITNCYNILMEWNGIFDLTTVNELSSMIKKRLETRFIVTIVYCNKDLDDGFVNYNIFMMEKNNI